MDPWILCGYPWGPKTGPTRCSKPHTVIKNLAFHVHSAPPPSKLDDDIVELLCLPKYDWLGSKNSKYVATRFAHVAQAS
jgi:hypothetical protein